MILLLARLDGPWPLAIFAVAVFCQVIAGLWQRSRRTGSSRNDDVMDLAELLGGDRSTSAGDQDVPLEPLTTAERTAIRERLMHGTAREPFATQPVFTPPPIPPPEAEYSRESGPSPTTENWVPWVESPQAFNEAHARLTQAEQLATESVTAPPDARQALRAATDRLAAADQAVQNARATDRFESVNRPPQSPLAAELARSLREPATARGAVIAGILLGRPKALED